MIVVFWLEHRLPQGQPHAKVYDASQLMEALRFAEELRSRRAAGESISHVTIQSELADNVGRAGIAAPPAPGEYVIGWKLDRGQREQLLARVAPRYARAVADHVTLRAGVAGDAALPPEVSAMIVGRSDDGRGVEALVVEIDGMTGRPDGSTYHITWSLAEGREAIESNDVIALLGWERIEPAIRVQLHPQRFP